MLTGRDEGWWPQRSRAGAGEWHEDKGDRWTKGGRGPGGDSATPDGAEAGAQDGPWQPLRPWPDGFLCPGWILAGALSLEQGTGSAADKAPRPW